MTFMLLCKLEKLLLLVVHLKDDKILKMLEYKIKLCRAV